jgi:hypothetical protein
LRRQGDFFIGSAWLSRSLPFAGGDTFAQGGASTPKPNSTHS